MGHQRVLLTKRVLALNRVRVEKLTVSLSIPPSANDCWRSPPGARHPMRSVAYKRWLDAAILELATQKVGFVLGRVVVDIAIGRAHRRRDVDNNIKPTLDLLKQVLFEDDARCERVTAWRDDSFEKGLRVTVEQHDGRAYHDGSAQQQDVPLADSHGEGQGIPVLRARSKGR